MLGYPSIPLVLSILLCWILRYAAIGRGLICHLWCSGLCSRTWGKQTHGLEDFPFLTGCPKSSMLNSRFRHEASPNPSVTTTLLKQLLCVGRQLKQQVSILLSLLSTTLCICTATAEEGSLMHLVFSKTMCKMLFLRLDEQSAAWNECWNLLLSDSAILNAPRLSPIQQLSRSTDQLV